MTKYELINRFKELEDLKKVHIENIGMNCSKSHIQSAIDCLECPDDRLDQYLEAIETIYPNIHAAIKDNGDYKTHSHNRFYVWGTGRSILREQGV